MKLLKIVFVLAAVYILYGVYERAICPPMQRQQVEADVDEITQRVLNYWLLHEELPKDLNFVKDARDGLNYSDWRYQNSHGFMSFDFEVSDYQRCGWEAGGSRIVRWGDGQAFDESKPVRLNVPVELRDAAETIAKRLLQHYADNGSFPEVFEALGSGWKYKAPTKTEPGFLMPDPPAEPVQYYLYFDFAPPYIDQ